MRATTSVPLADGVMEFTACEWKDGGWWLFDAPATRGFKVVGWWPLPDKKAEDER